MTAYPITAESKRTDTITRGLDRRIDVYRKRTVFGKWLASYLTGHQALEDAIWEVILERLFDNAVGEQLTILGRIVGQPRTTSDDNKFRQMIIVRMAINKSQGLFIDLNTIAKLLFGDSPYYITEYSTTIQIYLYDHVPINDGTIDPNFVVKFFQEARAAGIRLHLIYVTEPVSDAFMYADATGGTIADGSAGLMASVTE